MEEQQLSLLDLLHLNFTPKPKLDENRKNNGCSSSSSIPKPSIINSSPTNNLHLHPSQLNQPTPPPPSIPISPKTSLEQHSPNHNNNNNNNNNNTPITDHEQQQQHTTTPASETPPGEQPTQPITQENTKPTPDDTSDEIRMHKYMAIHLLNQIKNKPTIFFNPFSSHSPDSQLPPTHHTHPSPTNKPSTILASPHPHPPDPLTLVSSSEKLTSTTTNVGLRINSSFPPQELAISTDQLNPEILYTAEPPPHVLPITLFPSNMVFSSGNKVAVDGFISYATKAGRIRVIDQNSGARMLLRKHEGPVIDMCIGRPRGLASDLNNNNNNNNLNNNNNNTNSTNNTHNHGSSGSCSGSGSRRWRCIASAGSDGRLVIWKVPVRFEESSAVYEVLTEILAVDSQQLLGPEKQQVDSPRTQRFEAIRWHPRDPSVLLVSTNDHRLILVRLDRGAFAPMWKRGFPLGKPLSELEAFEGQDVLRTSCDVIAFAFSPDGSAFAFVTSDNILTVRQTSKPHWTIMGGQLSKNGGPISRLEFLSTPQGEIRGFLISKRYGTRVEAVQLSEISDVVIAINLQAPELHTDDDDPHEALPCFGHVAWQNQYSTILLSNSLRGSIFAFHLNFCDSSFCEDELLLMKPMASMGGGSGSSEGNHGRLTGGHQDDDSSYIERVAATRQSSKMHRSRSNSWVASRTMFVDHISEVASPDPIISFVLDQGMRPAPGPSSSDCSIFNLHPKGIHQLYLPKAVIDHQRPPTETDDIMAPSVPPARSLSLAGEILVDVRVEQEVAQAEELSFSTEPSKAIGPAGAPATEPIAGPADQQQQQLPGLTTAPFFVSPPQNGKHSSAPAAAPSHRDQQQQQRLSSSSNMGPPSFSTAHLGENLNPPARAHPDSIDAVMREIEKTREGLSFEFQNLFAKAMEKQDQRLRNQFVAQSEIETRRHEYLMNVVQSNTNAGAGAMSSGKNIAKLVEHAVRNELRNSPGLSGVTKGFEQSVLELVKRGVQEGFKKQLASEIESVMKKPQVTELIQRLVQEGVGHATEEKMEQVVSRSVIPKVVESMQGQQAATKGVVQEVQQLGYELRDLRAAECRHTEEMQELRETVGGLRGQIAELQEALKQALLLSSSSSSLAAAVAGGGGGGGGGATSGVGQSRSRGSGAEAEETCEQQQPASEKDGCAPGRGVPAAAERPETPPSAYEDMFLEALSDRVPGLLTTLIDAGPHDRLDVVFARAPNAAGNNMAASCLLSQPVLLTLAHKLAEQLALPENPVDTDPFASGLGARGANRLRWIWSCVDAVDAQDRQTAQYLSRVLDLSYSHLHARKLALIQAGGIKEEIEGINQVLWIIDDKLAKFRAANIPAPAARPQHILPR